MSLPWHIKRNIFTTKFNNNEGCWMLCCNDKIIGSGSGGRKWVTEAYAEMEARNMQYFHDNLIHAYGFILIDDDV